jgi:hypothetical protein
MILATWISDERQEESSNSQSFYNKAKLASSFIFDINTFSYCKTLSCHIPIIP